MHKRYFLWLYLLFALSLYAEKAPPVLDFDLPFTEEVEGPWFTGPLLAPSGVAIPPGHFNLEPYVFATANTAKYNEDWKAIPLEETFWNNFLQISWQIGVVKGLDFQINPTLFYNYQKGAAKWVFGDMPIGIDVQLYRSTAKVTDWITALKLALKEVLPIGQYQNLDPKKKGTDIGGGGSWQTGIGLVWGNLVYLGGHHFLSSRFSVQYILPAPVRVKNLNTYGGGRGTRGTVYPAQNFQIDIGTEVSLTQNWVLALDVVGSWSGKTRFKGKTFISNKAPSSVQFSLAPAIEYNWNDDIGIIFGPWFTVAGRNSLKFSTAIFAFNYYR